MLDMRDNNGYGSGYGSGYGDGYGSGYGDGSGSGYGDGDGYGYGDGDGDGIKTFDGNNVFLIDSIQTIIHSVRGNVAKCSILNKDLTLAPCYVSKVGNFFAHGETARDAIRDAKQKYEQNKPIAERIADFNAKFKSGAEYICKEFDSWHHVLTGSCFLGRDNFAKQNGININKDKMTREEFAELTKNSYGSDIILQLIKSWK